MYTSAKPYFYGTGRRKKSVARVRIVPGTGKITINKRDIDDYFGLETLKLIVNHCSCQWRRHLRPGRRYPSRSCSRACRVRCRTQTRSQSRRPSHPRPSYEGTQKVRTQSSSSRSSVLEEISCKSSNVPPIFRGYFFLVILTFFFCCDRMILSGKPLKKDRKVL